MLSAFPSLRLCWSSVVFLSGDSKCERVLGANDAVAKVAALSSLSAGSLLVILGLATEIWMEALLDSYLTSL